MSESKSDELRRLAQAVVDAWEEPAHMAYCHMKARELAGGINEPDAGLSVYSARALIAALDDATAQGEARGYARAMREVEAHAEATALKHRAEIERGLVTSGRVRGGRALHEGANNALHTIAEWARARAEVPRG